VSRRVHAPGVVIALLAGLHKVVIASLPINDDFMHRAYAQQLLAGEWPARDFFDYGMGLMYTVSALGQMLLGYRLLSEAVITGTAAALSTFLVYTLVRKSTDSVLAAVVAALLVLVATPRSYAYPKLIIYAVTATLWWRYVWEPRRGLAIALGIWVALAFFFRHDHGVYVAAGVVLALVAAHGVTRMWVSRCLLAGGVAFGLVAPFLVYASLQTGGVTNFLRTEIAAAVGEHEGAHSLPMVRVGDVLHVDEAEAYAPTIGIRWSDDSTQVVRSEVIDRYELTGMPTEDAQSQRVRLSKGSLLKIRELLAEPAVEDTSGLNRSAATVEESAWPTSARMRFRFWWLRASVFPGLDVPDRAGEVATVLLYAVSLVGLIGLLPWCQRYLPAPVVGGRLAAFALFTVLVDMGMLRTPYAARVADGVILPAVLLGIAVAIPLQMRAAGRRWLSWLGMPAAIVLALLMLKSVATAGQFFERGVDWVAGDWTSMRQARGAWGDVRDRLWASPPVDYWREHSAPPSTVLASYARDCVPPTDRVLALWFAPEIYYYSDRLMGGRQLYFLPAFAALEHEQQMEVEKVARTQPPIVFADSETATSQAMPALAEYVRREYEQVGFLDGSGDRYRILARRGLVPAGRYGEHDWPCFR